MTNAVKTPVPDSSAILRAFLFVSLLLSATSLPYFLQSVYGQDLTDYLTYSNALYGINIDYPSDWYEEEYPGNYLVAFYSPYEDQSDDYSEYVGMFVESVPKGTTLSSYVDDYIDELKVALPELDVLETDSTTLSGFNSMRVISTDTDFDEDGKNDHKTMRIFVMTSNIVYVIIYDAVQGSYDLYLDTVEQMLASVSIDADPMTTTPAGNAELEYQNSTYGVRMRYPDNWFVESLDDEFGIARFYSPYDNDIDAYAEYVYLGHESVPPGAALSQYVEANIQSIKETEGQYYQQIESIADSLAGLPGHRLTYTTSGLGFEDAKVTVMLTIKDDRGYVMLFSALKSTYDHYIPMAEKMFDSLEVSYIGSYRTTEPVSTSPTINEFLDFNSSAYHFSIQYPDNWQKIETNVPQELQGVSAGTIFLARPTGNDAIVTVSVQNVRPLGMTLENYADDFTKYLRSKVDLLNIEESGSTTLAGHPAHKFVYSGLMELLDNQLASMKGMNVATIIGNKVYLISYIALPQKFDQYSSTVVERMIDSFTVDESSLPKMVAGTYANAGLGLELDLSDRWLGLDEGRESADSVVKTRIIIYPANFTSVTDSSGTNATKPVLPPFVMLAVVGNEDILNGKYEAESESSSTVDFNCAGTNSFEIIRINDVKAMKVFTRCDFLPATNETNAILYDSLAYAFVTSENTIFLSLNLPSAPDYTVNDLSADMFSEFDDLVTTLNIEDAQDLSDLNMYVLLEADAHTQKVSEQTVFVDEKPYSLPVISNSTLSKVELDQEKKQLSFTVEGEEGTTGNTSIEVSKVLTGPFTILVDGVAIPEDDLQLIEDRTTNGTIVSMIYPRSTHEITIIGTNVVPEFGALSTIILGFIIALTISALMLFPRYHSVFRL